MKKTISPIRLSLIALLAGSMSSQAVPVTWTGANGPNWNDAGNWTPALPGTGDTLIFGTSGQTAPNNDLTGLLLGGITFTPTGAQYVLGGNAITLDTASVVNSNTVLQTIGMPMVLTNAVTFNTVSNLDTTVGDIEVLGAISGDASGALIKTGGGTLTLANKSYGGGTTVNGGLLVVSNDNGGYTMSGGALKLNYGSYWSGPTVGFTADAEVGTDAGRLDFAGSMGSPGFIWTKIGSGTMNMVYWNSDPTAVVKASAIFVAEGTLGTLWNGGNIAQWGSTNVPISVANGAALSLNDGCLAPNNSITLAGGAGVGRGALLSGRVNAGIDVTNTFTGAITLQSDTSIGTFGGILVLSGNISGTGPLTRIGTLDAYSQNKLVLGGTNTYTGDTTISTGLVMLASSAALPSGASAGNVNLANDAQLDLNGYDASVNGLTDDAQTIGFIDNSAATAVTLTFGGNNQAVSLVRPVKNTGGGPLSVVKVGSGTATLLGANTYSGSNVVAGGKLEIYIPTGTTTANGPLVVADGAEFSAHFRLAGSSLKTTGATLGTSGATILYFDIGAFGNPSLPIVNATNGTGILDANGTITVNIAGDSTVMSVGQFPIIKYATRSGNGNFVLGSLPANVTAQIVTNAAAKSIDLKVTSAPVTTWVGNVDNLWDIDTTANWSILGVGGKKYLDGVGVFFGDSVMTNTVDLTTALSPSSTLVNSTNDYSFTGAGSLNAGDLTKSGSGKLTLLTPNAYNNTTIAGGTLQVDTNGTTATLGYGTVAVEGTLIFARSDAIDVGNTITGSGLVAQDGSNTLTLSSANTYAGGTLVNQGAVKLGSSTALGVPGTGKNLAVVASGASLDINGQYVTTTNATRISGAGLNNSGAIYNSGSGTYVGGSARGINNVVLTGDAVINATGDWIIGESGLGISGNGYNLIKTGYGAVYLRASASSAFNQFVIGEGGILIQSVNPFGTSTTLVISNNAWLDSWGNNNGFQAYNIPNNILVTNGGARIMNTRGHWWNTPDADTYTGAITLADTLTLQNSSARGTVLGVLTASGPISGSGGVTKSGPYLVTLSGANTYTGSTTVSNGTLAISAISQGGGAYTNADGATLDVPSQTGYSTVPMSSLSLGSASGSSLSLARVSSFSASQAAITATNLDLNGANLVTLPGAAFVLPAGAYPLIKYTTFSGTGDLSIGGGVRGVPGYISNNVANSSINLVVPGGTPVVWTGNANNSWDIFGNLNWQTNGVSTDYEQTGLVGDAVTFNDSSSVTNVDVTVPVSPVLAIFNNTNKNYTLFGTNLTGASALVKNGTGTLTLSNLNNNFSGGTFVGGGTLKVATQLSPLVAMNNLIGTVTVAPGATLDMGSNNLQTLIINASGAGVGGNGAVQANYTGSGVAWGPSIINLQGNTTIGGNNRWDLRNGSKQLNATAPNTSLTKAGSGYFGLVAASVSTNVGDITILGGTLSYQTSTAGLGNTNNNLYIGNGGTLSFYQAAVPLRKPIVCSNGASIRTESGNTLGQNVIAGPVTLASGTTTVKGNYYNGIYFSNTISGPGSLAMEYQTYLYLAASNDFTGQLTVPNCGAANGGRGTRLSFIGNGSATKASQIYMQGVTASQAYAGWIALEGRPDATLTLGANQLLRGDNASYIRGSVVAPATSAIAPGGINNSNYQYMIIGTNLAFQAGSTNYMDIYKTATLLTNDLIVVSNLVTYAGTLVIRTNGTVAITNGDSFKLFSAGSSAGNFTTIADNSGATWSFDPATGIATVLTAPPTVNTDPATANFQFTAAGSALNFTWAPDHLGWQLYTNAVGLNAASSWFPLAGSASVTNMTINISPENPNVFFQLRYP